MGDRYTVYERWLLFFFVYARRVNRRAVVGCGVGGERWIEEGRVWVGGWACVSHDRDIGESVGASDYAGIVRKSMCLGRGGGVDASWRWRGRVVPRGDCRQSI